MNDENIQHRELCIFFGLVLLGKCDEVWVFGDKLTQGMAVELAKAKKRSMVVRYFDSSLNELGV